MYNKVLLKQTIKEVRILAFEGKQIPDDKMAEINEEAIVDDEDLNEVFESIMKYENKVKLNKWSVNVVKENFDQLKAIIDAQKTLEEKQYENTIVGQIGQNLMWLSSGAYSYMPTLYATEQTNAEPATLNQAEENRPDHTE